MKKILITISLLVYAAGFLAAQSAEDIVKKADQSFEGDRIYSTSTMTIYKSGEAQPVQEIESYTMEKGGKSYSLSIYTAPRRMKGTANLMIEDDLWVRFGSTGRTRKLSSSAKKNSAGGSDFSYADMGEGDQGLSKKYSAKMLGEDTVEKQDCYKIELDASMDTAPYEKMVVYISKDSYHYIKIDYFEDNANIKSITFYDYKTVNGTDYPFRYRMESHTKPSVSEVVVETFKVDSPKVQDRYFTTGYLKSIR